MKRSMVLFLAAFALLVSFQALGQPGAAGREQLRQELQLNTEQENQFYAVLDKYRGQMQHLRGDQTLDPVARKAEVQKVMEAQRKELGAILSSEQMAKWEALRKERAQAGNMRQGPNQPPNSPQGTRPGAPSPGKAGKGMQPGKNKQGNPGGRMRSGQEPQGPQNPRRQGPSDAILQMQKEVRAYTEQQILPVLQQERAKLERKISRKDSETLASLRTQLKATRLYPMNRAPQGQNRQKAGPARKGMGKGQGEVSKLAGKYKKELNKIFAGLEPKVDQWNKDLKAIREKHARDLNAMRKNKAPRQAPPGAGNWLNPERFLLLEPK